MVAESLKSFLRGKGYQVIKCDREEQTGIIQCKIIKGEEEQPTYFKLYPDGEGGYQIVTVEGPDWGEIRKNLEEFNKLIKRG